MKEQPRFIISGGGTGGHIYPAIAIAGELKRRYPDAAFLFVGAKDRMEMEKVPNAGYKIEGLWISGIQRKLTMSNLLFPLKLIVSLWKSGRILRKFRPDVVIGTGGFASGPLLKMANKKGIPTVLQEQNSFPGITNKWLADKAHKICVAYEGLERFFPKEKIIITGNPIRQDLLDIRSKRGDGVRSFGLHPEKKTLLILGGSLGARRINQLIEKELDFLVTQGLQLIWQCGNLYYEEYKRHDVREDVQVHPFLNEMDLAYAAADIIISRAGAGSVSELCVVGKPVLFIPSPNVAENHQAKNAYAIVQKDAALMLQEQELDAKFQETIKGVLQSETQQKKLGANLQQLALPKATAMIVDEIEKLM